jgi:ArsR family transcriptional regulator, arsenate/arsenite/antimonite-responsive transcriptional repressor
MTAHDSTDVHLATMAKALGHPARVAILRILSERRCVCGEIVDELPLAQSTVSEHLRVLKEAGWITGAIDGPRTCYAINGKAVAELRSVLGPLLERWEGAETCSPDSGCC